ncbi:hypothetical protein BU24DRAFT_159621 [Aaosphaeria arxii CBS 175.79]|uniref:Uncharacterized protein n=1 Tax=Aaosphaeria arxii CBS 175.79 TaxID=1450172 RepID=A0A6A5XYV0_9PLEO|nr:uncharacterized protein BU24DRAFT_159621 [Aaosphaeria arxii CBS 175.79]KAF2017810.1 hypothetical protein BU24DRAFT_159621 [Aaosphaeria arxii CBS 175.79]
MEKRVLHCQSFDCKDMSIVAGTLSFHRFILPSSLIMTEVFDDANGHCYPTKHPVYHRVLNAATIFHASSPLSSLHAICICFSSVACTTPPMPTLGFHAYHHYDVWRICNTIPGSKHIDCANHDHRISTVRSVGPSKVLRLVHLVHPRPSRHHPPRSCVPHLATPATRYGSPCGGDRNILHHLQPQDVALLPHSRRTSSLRKVARNSDCSCPE